MSALGFALLALVAALLAGGMRYTRLLWRELLRLFVLAELAAMALVRRLSPPRLAIVGECVKCGACCRQIVFDPPSWVKVRPQLLRLFIVFHRVMHNFSPVGRGDGGEIVFSCGHLRDDGRCGIYRYRPLLCRNYPLQPLFATPDVLPGCSYQVAPRPVLAMQRRQSLPIVNPGVVVHHPTRQGDREDLASDFEWTA